MLEKILSYFFTKTIYQTQSSISVNLEVNYNNGKLVLDSKNTNYSYGNLQKVLEKGLEIIGKNKIKNFQNILVLGVGAGSIIESLVEKYEYKNKIIGIELDEKVIEIAEKYFNIKKFTQLDLISYNAFDFVFETKKTFDFILIDIFEDSSMPNFLFENHFINRLSQILNSKGLILFNTMVLNEKDKLRNEKFIKENSKIFEISSKNKIEIYNELIFLLKKL